MKQATGRTNLHFASKQVSIQLSLDGHCFSIADPMFQKGAAITEKDSLDKGPVAREEATAADESVVVEVITPRTIVVPRAIFSQGGLDLARAKMLLESDGKQLLHGEVLRVTEAEDGSVGLVAVPQAAIETIEKRRPGAKLSFTTPLLRGRPAESTARHSVWIRAVGPHLYIKMWGDDGLRLAEVFPAPTDADRLYLLERIICGYAPNECDLRFAGPEVGELVKRLRRKYISVVCE